MNDTAGCKFDGDKNRWDLLPYTAVEEIVEILTFGAKKYAPNNWKYVPEWKRRYFAAMQRHLVAWWGGERTDQESDASHLAHAGCCLLFLMWLDKNGQPKEKESAHDVGGNFSSPLE